jgi:Cd2+/Zn2+-exporting ATPase
MSAISKTQRGASSTLALSFFERVRCWLVDPRFEAALVVVTFIAMMSGLIVSNFQSSLSTLFYLIAYIAGGFFGVQSAVQALSTFKIDVDLLMILAALGAWVVGSPFEGAMLLFLFSLSNVLQAYAIGRSRNAIRALMKLRPDRALVKRGNETITLPLEQIVVGDHIILKPGDRVPLDGVVVEGSSALDQSTLTGESMPVTKSVNDLVFAGTINQSGSLDVRVTKLAGESTIAKLIRLVEEAQEQKAPTERFLDKFEQWYALGVIAFTILLIVVPWLVFKQPFGETFYRAITVMVVASPCALIISTPASILSAIANAARKGILFKGGAHLEQAAKIDVVAFDKTGTLTEGKPTVTDVTIIPMIGDPSEVNHPREADQENVLLTLAAAVESRSEHPLALAIVATAKHRNLQILDISSFQATVGKGVRAKVNFMGGIEIAVGSPRYFDALETKGIEHAMREVERLQDEGKTSVLVAKINGDNANVLGVIAIADVIRPNAAEVVRELKSLGVSRVVMLTGDNPRVASAMAKRAGIDSFFADLLPEDKVAKIKELRGGAKGDRVVAMVGDGVNDAPALATASLGVAMGAAGTDVALETADIVLMSDDLKRIPYVIALSRQARKVVLQNVIFSVGVMAVLVLAALGLNIPLPLGVVGHEGSTVLVCLNGLRLLGFNRRS